MGRAVAVAWMVRLGMAMAMTAGLALAAVAHVPVPRPAQVPDPVRPVWAPVCGLLERGMVVRSARPVKDGGGSDRRRFWRGHWQVTQVLAGGRFLARPLYRKDDITGEIDRAAFDPFPGEVARVPPGALLCEAFVTG